MDEPEEVDMIIKKKKKPKKRKPDQPDQMDNEDLILKSSLSDD